MVHKSKFYKGNWQINEWIHVSSTQWRTPDDTWGPPRLCQQRLLHEESTRLANPHASVAAVIETAPPGQHTRANRQTQNNQSLNGKARSPELTKRTHQPRHGPTWHSIASTDTSYKSWILQPGCKLMSCPRAHGFALRMLWGQVREKKYNHNRMLNHTQTVVILFYQP